MNIERKNEFIGKLYIKKTTGFKGTCTAYAIYENGRKMLLLEALDTTGRPIEGWYDIEELNEVNV